MLKSSLVKIDFRAISAMCIIKEPAYISPMAAIFISAGCSTGAPKPFLFEVMN